MTKIPVKATSKGPTRSGAKTRKPVAKVDGGPPQAGDRRAEMLGRARAAILSADPDIIETVKWRKPTKPEGVPVFEKSGIICTAETYKTYVKLTFMHGAALEDPAGLFNAPFTGATRRAIDFKEGGKLDTKALKALVKAAVALNAARKKKSRLSPLTSPASPRPPSRHHP
jgi:hypothetical protein